MKELVLCLYELINIFEFLLSPALLLHTLEELSILYRLPCFVVSVPCLCVLKLMHNLIQGVAITQENSLLDNTARIEGWLARFPMFDWVGGRTSEMSAVGLLPAALQVNNR